MTYLIFLGASIVVFVLARAERLSVMREGQAATVARQSLLRYYLSSGWKYTGYETYLSLTVFTGFLVSSKFHSLFGLWIVTVSSFYVTYRLFRQYVIRKSHKLKVNIDKVTPNFLHMLATAYAASSKDVTQALRATIEQIEVSSVRNPILEFIDGIQEGGDPYLLGEKTKLYFQNRLLKQVIDAIVEEKMQGGLFGERLEQLIDEAERKSEVENLTQTSTFDSALAAYFMAFFTVAVDALAVMWNPEIISVFKNSPLGIALVVLTVLLVGFNIVVADSQSMVVD